MTTTDPLRRGFIANLPVAASVGAYGAVLGVLAAQKSLTWLQLLVMDFLVFAGSAQFVMVEMWIPPIPVLEIALAVMVINLRYMLVGASLAPIFRGTSLRRKFLFMHLVADENWAVTMAAARRGEASTGYLLGGGLCVFSAWCAGTMTGHRLGAAIQNPEAFALDFAFIAVFTALTASLWRGKADLAPWLTAALCAVFVEKLYPGKWYILAGGLGGALVAAFQPREGDASETEGAR